MFVFFRGLLIWNGSLLSDLYLAGKLFSSMKPVTISLALTFILLNPSLVCNFESNLTQVSPVKVSVTHIWLGNSLLPFWAWFPAGERRALEHLKALAGSLTTLGAEGDLLLLEWFPLFVLLLLEATLLSLETHLNCAVLCTGSRHCGIVFLYAI